MFKRLALLAALVAALGLVTGAAPDWVALVSGLVKFPTTPGFTPMKSVEGGA